MILDDPTSSLDNKVTSNILTTISTHPKWSKKTYIISTRKLSALRKFDRVIFMLKGAIRFFGTYSDLKLDLEFQQFEKIEGEREITETEQEDENEAVGDQKDGDTLSASAKGKQPKEFGEKEDHDDLSQSLSELTEEQTPVNSKL